MSFAFRNSVNNAGKRRLDCQSRRPITVTGDPAAAATDNIGCLPSGQHPRNGGRKFGARSRRLSHGGGNCRKHPPIHSGLRDRESHSTIDEKIIPGVRPRKYFELVKVLNWLAESVGHSSFVLRDGRPVMMLEIAVRQPVRNTVSAR